MIYRFHNHVLDSERRELRRGGEICHLEPQVFDLLDYLIRNRHRVVSRDELMNAVWRGRVVSEATLDTRLSAARHAINDTGAAQRMIRTLRTKGFRFVGAVREEAASTRTAHDSTRRAEEAHRRALLADYPAIAVLPFANLSGDPTQDATADALTEYLITTLSKVGWLSVTTRASSFAYKDAASESPQIARRLGVRYLLEGSIRVAADRERVTARLVDTLADRQIWAEIYDLDGAGGLGLHDQMCDKVATAIEPQIYIAEHSRAQRNALTNPNAWECIVRALPLMNSRNRQDLAAAQVLLQRAISIDPQSAQGHALLSIITTLRVHMSWADRRAVVAPALALARKALALNPDEPWAHAALGYASIWKHPDDAIAPCQRAIALNPTFGTGHYFLALASTYAGHHGSVFGHAEMAERLAGRDLLARGYGGVANNVRATACFAMERYGEGVQFARRAAVYNPNSPIALRALVINLALEGKVHEARHGLQALRHVAPEMSQHWIAQNAVWAPDRTMKRYTEAFRASGLV